jgi:hypothetical protein
VFRQLCGASPTEYRQEFAHRDQPLATGSSSDPTSARATRAL